MGEDGKVKLLYCSGTDGLNVIAKGAFHAEILDLLSNNVAVCGAKSLEQGTGTPVDMEQIVLWNPDVIVFAPGSIYSTVGKDPAWQKLKAIKNGKYYEVPEGPYNWMDFPPSVNRYMGMIWLSQVLYPKKPSTTSIRRRPIFELFYHSKITRAVQRARCQFLAESEIRLSQEAVAVLASISATASII